MEAKYIVRVNIFESEINGIRNSSEYEYIFEEPNLIESRNKAIEQAKDLITFMTSGTKNKFTSLSNVESNNTKHFHAFQIDLLFSTESGVEYQIFGEEKLMIRALLNECIYYFERFDSRPSTTIIQDSKGDEIEVLESNLEFFLN